MDVKTQLAPKGLEFRASDFVISDKWATILTVISYHKFIFWSFSAICLICASVL